MHTPASLLQARRYRLPLPLRVWLREGRRTASRFARQPVLGEDTITENISASGCYFLLSDGPKVGSKAEMEITISNGVAASHIGKVRCRGKVVRVEDRPDQGRVGVACTIGTIGSGQKGVRRPPD